tara:strand:- start:1471 stop:1944 length:474 start_codon:yes stop_codon:yes gene_type:complete
MDYKRKEIEGFENYEIDTDGTVYSLRIANNPRNSKFRDGRLSERIVGSGYAAVSLYDTPKKPKQIAIHRLVYETFIGPIPDGLQIDHIDNCKTNNKIDNLQLMTAKENMKKMWDNRGRSVKKKIAKEWLNRGYTRKFICDNLNISQSYVCLIANGKR